MKTHCTPAGKSCARAVVGCLSLWPLSLSKAKLTPAGHNEAYDREPIVMVGKMREMIIS
jgi:hypothetical protein